MNPELAALLAKAGYARAVDRDAWASVIVVNNFGSVPRLLDLPPEFALRGFKLLLLDAAGHPTHFARCGSASDRALLRESQILEALCRAPDLNRAVPHTRTAASDMIRVLVSAYLSGQTYDQFIDRETAETWTRSVIDVLELVTAVTYRAGVVLPDLVQGESVIELRTEVRPRLELLRQSGVEPRLLETIDAALSQVPPVGRKLQHGDLWPGNLVWHDQGWWLIDFAEFAHVQVPMYDAFHLLHYNPGRWQVGSDFSWLRKGSGGNGGSRHKADIWRSACARIAHQWKRRLGLGDQQLGGLLVYYLVYISSYRLRAGVPFEFGEPFLRDLQYVTNALRSGATLDQLIPG